MDGLPTPSPLANRRHFFGRCSPGIALLAMRGAAFVFGPAAPGACKSTRLQLLPVVMRTIFGGEAAPPEVAGHCGLGGARACWWLGDSAADLWRSPHAADGLLPAGDQHWGAAGAAHHAVHRKKSECLNALGARHAADRKKPECLNALNALDGAIDIRELRALRAG